MGKGSMSISVPWNLFELPPSSCLDIAKDNIIGSLVLFCLKVYTTTNHISSLITGGDWRLYLRREI